MYAVELAARPSEDPVSPRDFAAIQFGEVTVNADPEDADPGQCVFPVFKECLRQDHLIQNKVHADPRYGSPRVVMRFQRGQPKCSKVQTHQIALITVKVKSIGVMVTLRREHGDGVVYAGQKVRRCCVLL